MRLTTLSNYYLIDWWCDIDFKFACLLIWYKVLLQLFDMKETGGPELASTITLVLQPKQLTKCASQMLIICQTKCIIYHITNAYAIASWCYNHCHCPMEDEHNPDQMASGYVNLLKGNHDFVWHCLLFIHSKPV